MIDSYRDKILQLYYYDPDLLYNIKNNSYIFIYIAHIDDRSLFMYSELYFEYLIFVTV